MGNFQLSIKNSFSSVTKAVEKLKNQSHIRKENPISASDIAVIIIFSFINDHFIRLKLKRHAIIFLSKRDDKVDNK